METIDKIKMLLKEKKLDQKDLTSYLGITKSVFSAWKKGTSTSYTKYYSEIAEFFGVPVSAIVDDDMAETLEEIMSNLRETNLNNEIEKSPPHGTKDFFRDLFSDLTESEIDDLTKYAKFLRYLRDHPEG